jgi:hypothetical protein
MRQTARRSSWEGTRWALIPIDEKRRWDNDGTKLEMDMALKGAVPPFKMKLLLS